MKIKIDLLNVSPYQGRFLSFNKNGLEASYETINELLDSLKKSGLLQPIIVRRAGKKYEIIDGHRRVLAYKKMGEKSIEAIVKDCGDREAQVLSIVGNLQRRNLTRMELAITYKKALDMEFFKGKKELSKAIGKDETYVGDIINLLNLDKRIIVDLIKHNKIRDIRILRAIRKVAPSNRWKNTGSSFRSDKQWKLYRKIIDERLTREEVKNIVEKIRHQNKQKWRIEDKRGYIKININTTTLSKKQKALILNFMNTKLKELDEKYIKAKQKIGHDRPQII